MNSIDRIRIILVRPFHPGNIGSAARAMKTMGLTNLWLVNPREFPSPEATKMAAGAVSLLESATVTDSLAAAVADCTVVVASTARPRGYDLPELRPPQAAEMLLDTAASHPVALVFGPERMGLHNEDMRYARHRVTIPANPEYSSLNIAAAVQIMSYEVYQAATHGLAKSDSTARLLPTAKEIERLHTHLEEVLREIGFLRSHSGETMDRLRTFLLRAEPDSQEVNILRGVLSRIQKSGN